MSREKRRGQKKPQLGLLDMGSMDFDMPNIGMGDEDDDPSLEAELMAITSGKMPARPSRKPKAVVDMNTINALIADNNKLAVSDEDDDGGSDLENDPALMAELLELTNDDENDVSETGSMPPPLPPRRSVPLPSQAMISSGSDNAQEKAGTIIDVLEERVAAYKVALAAADTSSKKRRFERGLKTLESLLASAKAGKSIDEDSIPPMVASGPKKEMPSTITDGTRETADSMLMETTQESREDLQLPEGSHQQDSKSLLNNFDMPDEPTLDAESQEIHAVLVSRRDQYKKAALAAKKNNDTQTAIQYVKIAKQFDNVLLALEQGQPIDLSGMPSPPPGFSDSSNMVTTTNSSIHSSGRTSNAVQGLAPMQPMNIVEAEEQSADPETLFNAPSAPTSILEALQQRLQKYKSSQAEAQEQSNSSKARRMGRIVKQYEDAIKNYKAGKPVSYDDLPDPPGFGPIPHGQAPAAEQAPANPVPKTLKTTSASHNEAPANLMDEGIDNGPLTDNSNAANEVRPAPPPPPKRLPGKKPTVRNPQSLNEKQLKTIVERQRLFREAAVEAKKRGDIEAAKEYLRLSKGFAPMIEAAKCGLPVNIDSAPVPPQLQSDDSFEVVEHEDCTPPGDREEAYSKLEDDLIAQITMCHKNASHFSQLGDVGNSRKFHKWEEDAKKDLTAVRQAYKRGDPVPRFHYETRAFSIIQCFTDLTDNDLELTVVRGINYSCSNPKEIDTYVRFEFPFPSDAPPRDKTSTVKDTNNPDYNRKFVLTINRKARALARIFKRGVVKCEVVAKGGFFRGDTVLGTAHVKLFPLETKCLVHDSFDLMDGRRAVGGKLEVKIRIREPLLSKQVEEIKERWLIIDQFF